MRLFENVTRVYLNRGPVDFRRAIDGHPAIVEHSTGVSPFDAALYVFVSRRRDKLTIRYWVDTGCCLWIKRLEEAKLAWPGAGERLICWNEEQLH